MKIGLLHLTDIHFSPTTNVQPKIESIKNIVNSNFISIEKLYIAVTGDIAEKGSTKEYLVAEDFFRKLIEGLKAVQPSLAIEILFVPGNHDCNFESESDLRKSIINNISYNSLGSDNSVIDCALSVQSEFWEYYSKFRSIPENKLYYRVEDKIGNFAICFHCYNTAWMSNLKEKPGTLFFPVKNFQADGQNFHLDIGLYHHPINWFTPKTEENNKIEFQLFLEKTCSIQLVGHEHIATGSAAENLDKIEYTICISGQNFNLKNQPGSCGFNLIEVDLLNEDLKYTKYSWDGEIFISSESKKINYSKKEKRELIIKKEFLSKIAEIGIPLNINSHKLKLGDIFIYPHLERMGVEDTKIDEYTESGDLLSDSDLQYCILEGESQSGKSSLLKTIFTRFYEKGVYPILIDGTEIKNVESDQFIKNSLNRIYETSSKLYDRYKQLPKSEKVILIDNFHRMKGGSELKQDFLRKLTEKFSNVILTIDTANGILPFVHSEFSNYKSFKIKAFGYKKRNEIIEKYLKLQDNTSIIDEEKFLKKIQNTYEQIGNLLGNEVLPSYPVFLLTLLHALSNASYELKETSFAYCYQTLLTLALVGKAKVENEDLSVYFNFLESLSYKLFTLPKYQISEADYIGFQAEYAKKWILPDASRVTQKLVDSQILRNENGTYEFGYKYIFYYLVAKYLAKRIAFEDGKEAIKSLFENLEAEINANILVFITHHNIDSSFIQDSVLHAMLSFSETKEITLDKDCHSYLQIGDIIESIKNDVIDASRNKPLEERKKALQAQDSANRETERRNVDASTINQEIRDTMMPFLKAFRLMDIVGQIAKNRKGSLQKDELSNMIKEIYLNGFRMISSFGGILSAEKDLITEEIKLKFEKEREEKYKDKKWMLEKSEDEDKISKRIKVFFNLITLETCLSVFAKIIQATGMRDLKEIYMEVAKEIGTPAAKLVSFSINSYFNKVTSEDVKELAEEFKDNFVALFILKARVKSYIYYNYVDHREKMKLAQILDMKIINNRKTH
ncbi:metallophosphoesterase [Leptospira koniambonensis]|uniref:Metallophosphoesterase n=1 Tax=Leptospira koniambonensis TaxID=2484950 RepID=A0A4R9JBJ6_9LEPT|nr:metallophosphoesterase [Leptospira koniambonensis]TGL36827.1 metallophosphoesterase [Leptospira koniambonensis]